mmetsp:Transcript_36948/g.61254  ORF Transcript_36948/g.61254 Transcript_36948/m.61254 type:complete len:333 (+) Transcript_36948:114-1112(+)
MRLPILDLAQWSKNPVAFARELRQAAHNVGFFQIRHGRSDVAVSALNATTKFFSLSKQQKMAIDYRLSPAFRGYMEVGVENTGGKIDMREQIELAVEGEPCPAGALPAYRRLEGPNQWPDDALPELRPALLEFADLCKHVSKQLTAALCAALQVRAGAMDSVFRDGAHWQLKAARYLSGGGGEDSFGVGAHSDSGFLTLLLQDSHGLQVHAGGDWVDVPPAGPSVLVCNLGEVAEMMTGGYLLATPHRVLRCNRISIPFFYNPSLSSVVEPLQLPRNLPSERAAGHVQRHWRSPDNQYLAEYGMNAFKSLARSHPQVMVRHHPDLVPMFEYA